MSLPFRYPDKPRRVALNTFADMTSAELAKYISQRKYDGWRCLAFIDSANTVRCMSRANRPLAQAYRGSLPPELEASSRRYS